jgi:hypothetical protein
MNVQQLENELWEAADQLRANSKLTAAEYAMPVLGLIFLRHADNRFKAYLPEIEADIPPQVPAAQRETLIKLGFQGTSIDPDYPVFVLSFCIFRKDEHASGVTPVIRHLKLATFGHDMVVLHLPSGAYDADEINLKANAVFAHIYTAGFGEGSRVYH